MSISAHILGIDNVFFEVGDYQVARDFYEGLLGFQVEFEFPAMKSCGYRLGEETPGLGIRESASPTASQFWVEVDDVDVARREIPSGVEIAQDVFDIRTGKVFIVSDPWDNKIGFTDYVYQPEKARKSR